jgi:ubiquinone/menaquinone biosynthesis C-methylase UbiE
MTNDATDRVRQDWDSQAKRWYELREPMLTASRPIHEWMVEHLDPESGERILEIAAGPGDTGFLAARRLGSGHLVSTDLSSSMVDAARSRGEELGIANAEYRTLDAQAMDLPDGSFDGIICRWGFMLMPDPAAAFRECRRVLVPGGRLVLAVFTGPDKNPFASIPARILREMSHTPPASGGWQPGILALADRATLESLMAAAGFTSIEVEAVAMTWTFGSLDDYWSFLVDMSALGPRIRALSEEARARFRATLNERLAPFTSSSGIALPSECWCASAAR